MTPRFGRRTIQIPEVLRYKTDSKGYLQGQLKSLQIDAAWREGELDIYNIVDHHSDARPNCKIYKFKKYRPRSQVRLMFEDPFQSIVPNVDSDNFRMRQLHDGNKMLLLYRNYENNEFKHNIMKALKSVTRVSLHFIVFALGYYRVHMAMTDSIFGIY